MLSPPSSSSIVPTYNTNHAVLYNEECKSISYHSNSLHASSLRHFWLVSQQIWHLLNIIFKHCSGNINVMPLECETLASLELAISLLEDAVSMSYTSSWKECVWKSTQTLAAAEHPKSFCPAFSSSSQSSQPRSSQSIIARLASAWKKQLGKNQKDPTDVKLVLD